MENLSFIVDIGNTQISIGIFLDRDLLFRDDYPSHKFLVDDFVNHLNLFLIKSNLTSSDFSGGLISSVVPSLSGLLHDAIKELLSLDVSILSNKINKNIDMDIDNPLEVGGDILADIIATKNLYKTPALVVDLGTVTKFIVLDEKGTFIGTTFYSGIQASIDSLSDKTALLPNLKDFIKPKSYLGKNTNEAMESGIFYGTIGAIKEISSHVKEMFNSEITYILTGGFSNVIYSSFKDVIFNPNLTLIGVNDIYKTYYGGNR